MKTLAGLFTAIFLSCLAGTASASLMFDWQFVVGSDSTSGPPGAIVSGTIGGLVEGVNDGSGLTVSVNPTPLGTAPNQDWTFLGTFSGPVAFLVSGGAVVEADAFFENAFTDNLRFGTSPSFVGGDTFAPGLVVLLPQLEEYNACSGSFTACAVTTFTRSAVPAPATLLLFVLGLAGVGQRYCRRRMMSSAYCSMTRFLSSRLEPLPRMY